MKISAVFLLFLLFAACKNEPEKASDTEVPLNFEISSITKKSGEGCLDDNYNCTLISLEIPIAEGPENIASRINTSIKKHVVALINSEEDPGLPSYEEFAKDFIAERQRIAEEFEESAPWRAIVTGRIFSENKHLLCIGIDSEIFTGGAHGYRSISFFNFDPETGSLYEHDDIFTEEFVSFAEKAFKSEQGIPEEENINSTGFWFEDDVFHLPNNIGFEDNKVILIYSAYEIASYADGEFRLEFTKEEVAPYIKLPKE